MKDFSPSLQRLALLARERPNLLAGPLALYQEQEGVDDQQLAELLGCRSEDIPRLALCERPRSAAPYFLEDVTRIAAYISADVMQLARLIRAAEAREVFNDMPDAASPTLLAARDYEDEDDNEPTDG